MASLNKQSLREEFEALKGRFGQLSSDGKVGAESRALIEALLMLMQVLMAVFMEFNVEHVKVHECSDCRHLMPTPEGEAKLSRCLHAFAQ